MSGYVIEGGRRLEGSLRVQGAKNSVLPLLAAALLAPGESVFHNCPNLSDVDATRRILEQLGCGTRRQGGDIWVDGSGLSQVRVPEKLMGELRSSVVFLGALLARAGEAELSCPGGCELGPRPIDLHLAALRGLGAEIVQRGGGLSCSAGRGLKGRELCLSIPSVGATENVMLCACGAEGTTILVGAAREPEIVDLQGFLNAMGAKVSGAGSDRVVIEGGQRLHPAEYTVMGDRIAAATYLCAAGATGGEIDLTGVAPEDMTALLCGLREAGCQLRTEPGRVLLRADRPLRGISPVRTAPYPGFPTDAQALFMAALCGGVGNTLFEENMFDSRYGHVEGLRRMGADIQLAGRAAMVTGVGALHGAAVRGTDLRGTAALVVAALGAQGRSTVEGLSYIRRGYEAFAPHLRALGAEIEEAEKETGESHGSSEEQTKTQTEQEPLRVSV